MKKTVLFLFATVFLLKMAVATGEPSTYFNIYVPPNNDATNRYVALIVTAIQDSTYFQIIDDGMDGDTDDSHSGMLMANQSYILYIKDNGINDDARGSSGGVLKADGDYFIIQSDKLVYASQSTDSDWQHDWVPSINKSSKGKKFVLYAPDNSYSNRDLNVFAFDDQTTVTVKRISPTSRTTTGYSQVDANSAVIVVQKTLNIGEDLIYAFADGRDVLESGHTYLVESNKDITVQYGALYKNVKDGGGYVPSSNGSSSGELFYFTVPYDKAFEQEIRMVSWDDSNTVVLDRFENNTWVPTKSWNLSASSTADWVGKAENASYSTTFRVTCSPNKKVSVFEANWLETGNPGTSDIATMASSHDGTTAGKEFICYMAPPGNEQNAIDPFTGNSFGGAFTHLFLFASDSANVTVKDAYTNGQEYSKTFRIAAGRYADCSLSLQEWRTIYNGDGNANSGPERPYLVVTSDVNISVMNTNFNDNWMMYFGSSLEQSFNQKSSSSQSDGIPGDTVSVNTLVELNTANPVSNVSARVIVGTGSIPQSSVFVDAANNTSIDGKISTNDQGSIITFDSLPDLDQNGNYSIVTEVILLAANNDGSPLGQNSVVTVETSVSGVVDGKIQQSTSSEGISLNPDNTSNLIYSQYAIGNIITDLTDSWNASWVDTDSDGDQDLFVCSKDLNGNNRLYSNNGNGTFTSITNGVLVNTATQAMSSAWADVDNDGDMDVLMVNNNYHPLQLYRNNGNNNFTKVNNAGFPKHPGYYHGASWADVNNDGLLDVVVTNYLPTRFHELYLNLGNGQFELQTNSIINQQSSYSVAPTWVDYDNDGQMDLFLPNNLGGNNALFRNTGGQFVKVNNELTVDGGFSVAAVWADPDNDGDMDVFVANSSGQKDFFYFNNGDGSFTRDSTLAFTNKGSNTHGCSWLDVDNDMDLDLYLTDDQGAKQLYIQTDNFTFYNKVDEKAVINYGNSYGQAVADYNKDGHLDIFVSTHSDQENFLWTNNGNDNHFINITFKGTASNSNAIGTKVRLKAGNVWQTSVVSNQNGFGSQNSIEQHFGLGANTTVDSLIVYWPSGYVQYETAMNADQFIVITEDPSVLVSGKIYGDINENCTMDATENGIGNQELFLQPLNKAIFSDANGNYEFRAPAGNYTLSFANTTYWNSKCGAINVQVTNSSAPIINQNVGLSALTYAPDLVIEYGNTLWRRGFANNSFLKVENKGTAAAYNTSVQLDFPTELDLQSSSVASQAILTNSFTWAIDTLKAGETYLIALKDSVNLTAFIGQNLTVNATVATANGETNTTNNTSNYSAEVVGSIDPNDILAWPYDGAVTSVFRLDTITYKIRFQNVGTYEAATVYVKSKLPQGVSTKSFKMLSHSHNCSYSINDGVIDWVFRNINLPDSSSNESESHGYVLYSLIVDRAALSNQEIVGQANITFDYESPLVTNRVFHRVINSSEKAGELKIWPNPAKTGSTITMAARKDIDGYYPILQSIVVSGADGRMLLQKAVNGTKVSLRLDGFNPGSYMIVTKDLEGTNQIGVLIVH